MDLLVTLGLVLLGGGFVTGVLGRGVRRRRKLWRRLAERHGGRYLEKSPIDGASRGSILIDRPAAEARPPVSIFIEYYGDDVGIRTRGHVRYPLPAGPIYRVGALSLFADIVSGLGPVRDLALGDASFDRRFSVKCGVGEAALHLTREAWTSRARELMARRLPHTTVSGRRDGVTVEGVKSWSDEAHIEALIALLDELGRIDFYGHGLLANLPEASFTPGGDVWERPRPPAATTLVRGREVTLGPVVDSSTDEAVMCATARNESGLPSFELILGDHGDGGGPAPPAGVYTPDTARLIDKLVGATLSATPHTLTVSFADRPVSAVDETALRDAAKLLALLASASQGAFR